MSEALPDNAQDPSLPESEARSPVFPPVQGTSPTWETADEVTTNESTAEETTESATPVEEVRSGLGASMTGTAERIGNAVGTAQRQWRRGLELVRRPIFSSATEVASVDSLEDAVEEGKEHASRLIADLEEDFADARREAAIRLDEWSDIASARFQQLRGEARLRFARSRARAQEIANTYPLQTIAVIAGIGFLLGATLRLRRSHRG